MIRVSIVGLCIAIFAWNTPAFAQMGVPYYADEEEGAGKKAPSVKETLSVQPAVEATEVVPDVPAKPEQKPEPTPTSEPPSPVAGNPPSHFMAQWERYRAARDKPDEDSMVILDAMLVDQAAAGWPNFMVYGRAVAYDARAVAETNLERALELARRAVRLAPDEPETHRTFAEVEARQSGASFWSPPAMWSYVVSLLSLSEYRLQHISVLCASFIATVILVSLFFILFAFIRNFRSVASDVSMMARWAPERWQWLMFYIALFLAPVLFQFGACPTVSYWLLLFAGHYRWRERMAAVALIVTLLGVPYLVPPLTAAARFQRAPEHDVQRAVTSLFADASAERLKKMSDDPAALYALGLRARWSGDLDKAIALFEKAAGRGLESALLYTSLGNAYFSLPKRDALKAIAAYRKAISIDPTYVVAFFNLGQALYSEADNSAGGAYRTASALDFNAVEAFRAETKRLGPRFVVHPGRDDVHFSLGNQLLFSFDEASMELWALLGGGFDLVSYQWFNFAILALLLVAGAVQPLLRTATPCLQCGAPASRRTAPEMSDQQQCGQCYHAFISGDAAPGHRLQKEISVRRYLSRRARTLMVLRFSIPGGHQLMSGASLRGVFWLGLAAWAVMTGLLSLGFLPELHALADPLRTVVLGVCGVAAFVVFVLSAIDSLRDGAKN